MGLFNYIYQFIITPVLTVLYHTNKSLLERVKQVCVQTDSDQGLRVSKDQRLNQKGNEAYNITPTWVKDINIARYKTAVHLCAEVPHELPEGQMMKPNKL